MENRRPSDSDTRRPTEGGTRSPSAGGIRSPSAGGIRSPSAGGIRSPSAGGIRSPSEGDIRSPSAGGIRRPSAMRRPSGNSKTGRVFYVPADYLDHTDVSRGRLPSILLDGEEYDPMKNRAPTHPITPWMAHINLLRTLLGPGLLIMPLAISQSGMLLGPIITMSIGAILIHTHILLLSCLNEVCRHMRVPFISYRYGFRLALLNGPPLFHWLGEKGPFIVALFSILSQLGICTVFVIITTNLLRDIMDLVDSTICLIALLPLFILQQCFARKLSKVSYVSSVGHCFNALGLITLVGTFFFTSYRGFRWFKSDIWRVFWCMGTVFFNMSAVAVVLTLDKALAQPSVMRSKFGVLKVGFVVATLISMFFGCLAYWSYGTVDQNILMEMPMDDTVTTCCFWLNIITLTLSYPIQCHPAIAAIVDVIKHHDPNGIIPDEKLKSVKNITRSAFVIVSFVIAYFVPHQGPFVAFVGNLCTPMLALTFPAMMDLCLRYPHKYGRYHVLLCKDLLLIILGIVVWILGIYYCSYIIYIRVLLSKSPSFKYDLYY